MRKITPIITGVVLVFITIWWNTTTVEMIQLFNERIDHIAYDLQLKSKLFFHHPISKNIVIIDIDDKSLKTEGHWPWSRNKIVRLINKLNDMHITAIAFDIIFSEKLENNAADVLTTLKDNPKFNQYCSSVIQDNLSLFEQDTLFAKSIVNNRVFLSYAFLPRIHKQNNLPLPLLTLTPLEEKDLEINRAVGYICNLPELQQAAKGSGFINITPDSDGIIRRAPVIMQYDNNIYASLALKTISTIFDDPITLIDKPYGNKLTLEGINVGRTIIPLDPDGQTLIPFIGGSRTFPYYSATDILHDQIPPEKVTGKIIIIGTSAVGLGDLQATAIQAPYPGVEIQATLMESILTNSFISSPQWVRTALLSIILIGGLLASFFFPYLSPRLLGVFVIVFPTSILLSNIYFLNKFHVVFSITGILFIITSIAILNMLYGYFFESRRREQIKMMFGQYVDEKHIEEIINAKDGDIVLHSKDKEMSVLFSDIRNFTSSSEKMKASELVEMLNSYLTEMTHIILKNNGTIDKYVGDLVMAFWGAPLSNDNHAANAIKTALEMQKRTATLSKTSSILGVKGIKIGIGVNSGIMSVGDMGSRYRRNYTVLGDAVNLASRLEGLSKFYGVDIVVSETTAASQSQFVFRKLDKVQVKGKKIGVTIYEPVGETNELTPVLKNEIDLSNRALDLYFERKWDESKALLTQLHKQHPANIFYKLFLDRNTDMKKNPPSPEWDGVYVSLSK